MPRKKSDKHFAWLVAYIDVETMPLLSRDLKRSPEYKEVEAFIPTVKVLRKTFKNKNFMEEVPLLFNYGFFKVPRAYALSVNFLDNMKENISCIFGWVKDPHKITKKPKKINPKKIRDFDIPVATASSKEVMELVEKGFNYSAHSAEDLKQVGEGSMIILRGYPWDGVQAEIVEIDTDREKAKVKINIFDRYQIVEVSFDNVFFTLYQRKGYDENQSTVKSLDELQGNNQLDKRLFKNYRNEANE